MTPHTAEAEERYLQAMTNQITQLEDAWANTVIPDLKITWINLQEDKANHLRPGQSYTNYYSGEPNSREEQCVAVGYNDKKWIDVSCDMELPYVCHMKCIYDITLPWYYTMYKHYILYKEICMV